MSNKDKISFTVDLEWWGRASLLEGKIPFHKSIDKDYASLNTILFDLEDLNIKATFFVVASDVPSQTVKRVIALGHEVASHCVDHSYYRNLSEQQWKNNVKDSKARLEDAGGQSVVGFRAPSWSVDYDKASFHLNVLRESGYEYDSSFSPFKTKLYGDKRFLKTPYLSAEGIIEFPLPTIGFPSAPWVGGTYLRICPRWFANFFIKKQKPCFLYVHPWEFYRNEEKLPDGLSSMDKFVTLHGRKNFRNKVQKLAAGLKNKFEFIPLREQAKIIKHSFQE